MLKAKFKGDLQHAIDDNVAVCHYRTAFGCGTCLTLKHFGPVPPQFKHWPPVGPQVIWLAEQGVAEMGRLARAICAQRGQLTRVMG